MYEESKKIFLDLLYSDEGKKYEAEIRYRLGLTSFYERNFADAKIQWKMLIKKFPTHKRSRELSRTADRWGRVEGERESNKEENRELICSMDNRLLRRILDLLNAQLTIILQSI